MVPSKWLSYGKLGKLKGIQYCYHKYDDDITYKLRVSVTVSCKMAMYYATMHNLLWAKSLTCVNNSKASKI